LWTAAFLLTIFLFTADENAKGVKFLNALFDKSVFSNILMSNVRSRLLAARLLFENKKTGGSS
jgi:hypothetical protein